MRPLFLARVTTLCAAALLTFQTTGSAQVTFAAPFRPEASGGLFVGVRDFVDDERRPRPGITPVKYAVDDAVDLAHLFAYELKLIAPSRIVLALSGEPQKAASQQRLQQLRSDGASVRTANFTTIYAQISELRTRVDPEGIMVVSFATHGFGDAGGLLYAADTDPVSRQRTSISVTDLQETVNGARTPRRIILLDACRELATDENARSAGVSASRVFAEAMRSAAGTAVVMATTAGGLSYDDDSRQNGVFTASFIDALRSGVGLQDDGLVTLAEVVEHTHKQVRDWVLANKPAAGSNAGISHNADRNALAIPMRADEATQRRIAAERNRLFAVLQRDRDQAFIPDGVVADVQEKLSTLTVADAKPLMTNLEVFASSAGRQSAVERSKAFLAWWQRQSGATVASAPANPPADSRPPAQQPNYEEMMKAATDKITGGAGSLGNEAFEHWIGCLDTYCSVANLAAYATRVREIWFGESRDNLDRVLDVKALAAEPRTRQYNLPIRLGTKTLFVQLLYADGRRSDVRTIAVTVTQSYPGLVGVQLKPVGVPQGVNAPAVFGLHSTGTTTVTVMPHAPPGTEAILYSLDDGGLIEHPLDSQENISAPSTMTAMRIGFRLADGKQIGPFRFELNALASTVAANTTSGLSAVLARAIACTRMAFSSGDSDSMNFEERNKARQEAMKAMAAGLGFVTTAPGVFCRAHRTVGREYWSGVKEVRFGTAPGAMGETVVLAEYPKQERTGSVPWHAKFPVSATAIYAQVVFSDGKTSRAVRLPIDDLK